MYLGKEGRGSPQVTRALLTYCTEAAAPGDFLLRDAVVKSLGQLGDASPEVVSALNALLPRDILLSSHESVLREFATIEPGVFRGRS